MPFVGIKLIDLVLVALRPGCREACHRMNHAQLRPALVSLLLLTLLTASSTRRSSPAIAQVVVPAPGERQPDRQGRQGRRLRADRPALRRPEVLLGPAVGDRAVPYNAGASSGSNLGPDEPALGTRRSRSAIDALRAADPGNDGARSPSISSPPRAAGSTRTSAPPPRSTRSPRRQRARARTRPRSRELVETHTEGRAARRPRRAARSTSSA